MKKLLTIIFVTLLIFTNAYAKDEIQVLLETPAVLQAKAKDTLKYSINIKLPKSADKAYKSFVVTVLIDENLELKSANLVGTSEKKGQVELKTTSVKNGSQYLITLAVLDLKSIAGTENIKVPLECVLKKDTDKVEGLKNSVILTSVGLDGKENTDQKSFIAQTTNSQGILDIKSVKENDTTVSGRANPNATVVSLIDNIEIARVKADKNGNFSMNIPKAVSDTKIVFRSSYVISGKNSSAETFVVVSKGEQAKKDEKLEKKEEKKEEKKDAPVVSNVNKEILRDLVRFAEMMDTRKLSMESLLKFQAALATGKYIEVKEMATPSEVEDAIKGLKEVIDENRTPYMSGITNNTFKVENFMTRGQGAYIFARLKNGEAPTEIYSSFSDVPQKMWYAEAIGYCEKNGIISGYDDKTFRPEKQLKRAEFAMIVYRYLGLNENFTRQTFSDVKPGYYAFDAINTLKAQGILTGDLDGKFNPEKKIKRGEAATIINRVLSRKPNEAYLSKYGKNPFKDLSKKHWAYYEVLEATGN